MATGFIVLNLFGKIKELKKVLNGYMLKTLYVHLNVQQCQKEIYCSQFVNGRITDLYSRMAQIFPNLDVRVVLNGLKEVERRPLDIKVKDVDIVIVPPNFDQGTLGINSNRKVSVVILNDVEEDTVVNFQSNDITLYDNVVLGGTFDRLHTGHKIMLTEALLRCRKKLTVGVTESCMLQSKWQFL